MAVARSAAEQPPAKTRNNNALNAILMVLVAVPAVWFGHWVSGPCVPDIESLPGQLCQLALSAPFVAVNLVFAVNVCLLFWLISLAQGSTWLIDPYWTFIPLFIVGFFSVHPGPRESGGDGARRSLVWALLCVWSSRLTHSYFRREEGQIGHREDWRFSDLRKQMPQHFWWFSLFYAYLSQQVMLVLLCLPFWPLLSAPAELAGATDLLGPVVAVFAIVWACFADTQLHSFMKANERRAAAGKPKIPILKTGLWRFSRHPNYFGEQLWWWAMALWAWNLGAPAWYFAGPAFNSLCMMPVTWMVERKMAARPERLPAWNAYKRQVPVWIPMFFWRADPARPHSD